MKNRKNEELDEPEYKSTFDSSEWLGYGTPTYGGKPMEPILPSKEEYLATLRETQSADIADPDSTKNRAAAHEATEARLAADPLCEKEEDSEDEVTTIRFVSKEQFPDKK